MNEKSALATADSTEKKLLDIFRAGLSLEMEDSQIQGLLRIGCPQWDSMGHLNLLLAAEEVFQISISEEEGFQINSFVEMLGLIRRISR